MVLKKNSERALTDEQLAARRRSTSHRSLLRRAKQREERASPSADAVVPVDAPADLDSAPDTEAPTDTVAFARVPEFLREDDEGAAAASEDQADHTDPLPVETTDDAVAPVVAEAAQPHTQESDGPPGADADPSDGEPAAQQTQSLAEPEEDAPAKKRKRRRWPWILVAIVLVLCGAYYGLAVYFGDHVPTQTKALGVQIGDLDAVDAQAKLDEAAAALESAPITLSTGDASTSVIPSDAGLSIDTAAMVQSVTGFTLNPTTLLTYFTGGSAIAPVVVMDESLMSEAMASASVNLDRASINATVTIAGVTATAHPGTTAIKMDHEDTAGLLVDEWPASSEIDVAVRVTDADVADHEATRMVDNLNSSVLASAVTLTSTNGNMVVEPQDFAPFLSVTPAGSRLHLVADGEDATAYLRKTNPDIENEPVNAAVSFDKNHKLVATVGEPGRAIDEGRMGAALVTAVTSVDHTGPVPYREVQPEVSAVDLGVKDFKEVVSSFSTPLTNEPIRTKNLVRGAEKVTGVIVKSHDNFDLTEVLSPISKEEGFYPAHVIVNGMLTTGMGGGLSQMSTTTYNAGYFAGYEDIDHRPHSRYFTRYPAGRESTIYTGYINMVFKNNTPYAAIMSSYVKDHRLYVDIWSTPYFTVKTEASPRTNVVQPKTVTLDRPDCEPTGGGQPGFTISNTRTVFLDGTQVDESTNKWTYLPDNKIICIE